MAAKGKGEGQPRQDGELLRFLWMESSSGLGYKAWPQSAGAEYMDTRTRRVGECCSTYGTVQKGGKKRKENRKATQEAQQQRQDATLNDALQSALAEHQAMKAETGQPTHVSWF